MIDKVEMTLENYDLIRSEALRYQGELTKCNQLEEQNSKLIHEVLRLHENAYKISDVSRTLNQLINLDDTTYDCGLSYVCDLFKLGITEKQMVDFIKSEFERIRKDSK